MVVVGGGGMFVEVFSFIILTTSPIDSKLLEQYPIFHPVKVYIERLGTFFPYSKTKKFRRCVSVVLDGIWTL